MLFAFSAVCYLFHLLALSLVTSNAIVQGKTLLIVAVEGGNTAAVRALVSAKANVEATYVTYLFPRPPIFKMLLIVIFVMSWSF
jgi:hypothetical protein